MKKSDLESGMVIEWNDNFNELGVIIGDSIRYKNGYDELSILDENLRYKKDYISAIYKVKEKCCSLLSIFKKENLELILKRQREIDWSKVPKWTKVQVRHNKKEEWENSYFLYESPYCHPKYKTSFGDEYTNANEKFFGFWNNCRIHPSVTIPEEWYKE